MVAHFTLDVDPLGGGPVTVNGDDVTHLIEGCDLRVRPGQPTALLLYMIGGATITGEGVVETVAPEPDAAAIQAEVGDLLRNIDAGQVWAEMMEDVTSDLTDPAAAFLGRVADLIDPRP